MHVLCMDAVKVLYWPGRYRADTTRRANAAAHAPVPFTYLSNKQYYLDLVSRLLSTRRLHIQLSRVNSRSPQPCGPRPGSLIQAPCAY